jgi:hypothetical protein
VRLAAGIVLIVTAAALAAGCGGSSSSSAPAAATSATPAQDLGDFFKQRIQHELDGEYGRSWESMHPGQQKIVSRSNYEECRRQAVDPQAGVEVKSARVQQVHDDPIDVPGVSEKKAKAVTLRLTFRQGSQEETTTVTYHTLPVDGHWVWMLPAADIRAFQNGTCPT